MSVSRRPCKYLHC